MHILDTFLLKVKCPMPLPIFSIHNFFRRWSMGFHWTHNNLSNKTCNLGLSSIALSQHLTEEDGCPLSMVNTIILIWVKFHEIKPKATGHSQSCDICWWVEGDVGVAVQSLKEVLLFSLFTVMRESCCKFATFYLVGNLCRYAQIHLVWSIVCVP